MKRATTEPFLFRPRGLHHFESPEMHGRNAPILGALGALMRRSTAMLLQCVGLILSLACTAVAQNAPPTLRVSTTQEGMHAIGWNELAPHGDPARIRTERIALSLEGRPVPAVLEGLSDRTFDRGDVIVFHAPAPATLGRKSLDFVLSWQSAGPLIGIAAAPAENATRLEEAAMLHELGAPAVYAAVESISSTFNALDAPLPHWVRGQVMAPRAKGNAGATDTICGFQVELDPPPLPGTEALLRLSVVSPPVADLKQHVAVLVNGKEEGRIEWSAQGRHELQLRLPPGAVRSRNSVAVQNVSEQARYAEPGNELASSERSFVLITGATLETTALLYGPGNPEEQIVFHIAPRPQERVLQVKQRGRNLWKLYDVTRGNVCPDQVVHVPAATALTLVAANMRSMKAPLAVAPLVNLAALLPREPVDWVCVTTSRFRIHADALAQHRSSTGLKTLVVEARALYDGLCTGVTRADAPRLLLQRLAQLTGKAPRFLLLLGDADRDADWVSERETIPALQVPTLYNGATAADALLGDLDADGLPEVAVGRIPARTPDALRDLITRIIRLETAPAAGVWRGQLAFCSGVPGFNPIVDAALKKIATAVLSKAVPPRLALSVLDADSPMDNVAFGLALVQRLETGALLFAYAGHAGPDALAPRKNERGSVRMLKAQDAATLHTGGRTPAVILLACSAGAFDMPEKDCLAEQMLLGADGPVALIASTRVSHPFPNALLGKALPSALFNAGTLGEGLLLAKKAMLDEAHGPMGGLAAPFLSKAVDAKRLVRDHVALYALLGDPATRLPVPEDLGALTLVGAAKSGTDLVVTAQATQAGTLTAIFRAKPTVANPNPPMLVSAVLKVEGAFSATLPLPAALPAGAYQVHLFVEGTGTWSACGMLQVTLTDG